METNTVTQSKAIRDNVLSAISEDVDKQIYDAFFEGTSIYKVVDNKVYIMCESKLARQILRERYLDFITQKLHKYTASYYVPVLVTEEEMETKRIFDDSEVQPEFFKNNSLDPHFTFDNFVVGPCNSEAQKAALYTATSPGGMYQTLFIYGQSGLGKTHLLNAIGNYIKNASPEKKVLLCSSYDFMEQYIEYVKGENKKEELFKFLKKFDVLLIDDIQLLKDKKKTQEFFFTIYEDFRQNHKQICFTSDRLPGELDGIDQRILTRFTSGLSVSITRPDTETCFNILKSKILASGADLAMYDEDVLYFMADKFQDSIRSLEGALIRLNFYASISKTNHVNIDLCTEALQSMIDVSDAKSKATEQKILSAVSSYYSLSIPQITGKNKAANIVNARHVAIYLIRDLLDLPLKKIGQVFGGRDHTTIIHSIEKVDKLLKTDPQAKIVIEELKKRISS